MARPLGSNTRRVAAREKANAKGSALERAMDFKQGNAILEKYANFRMNVSYAGILIMAVPLALKKR